MQIILPRVSCIKMALLTDRLVEKPSNATPSLKEPVYAEIY